MSDSDPLAQPHDGERRIRRALWWSLAVAIAIAGLVAALLLPRPSAPASSNATPASIAPRPHHAAHVAPPLPFSDITAAAGIDFAHHTGAYGERLLPETMGGGVAFLDYDNDGHQDLLLVNSAPWPWRAAKPVAGSRLYRNRGDGVFADVSATAGVDFPLYGMGVAVGDYDADGFVDVYLTAVGGNRLLRNVAGERFVDVTTAAGVSGAQDAWSTSAAFFDGDGDGDLDLFVCNYVAWSPSIDRAVDFRLTGIGRAYGPPTDFAGTDSVLYRNDGGAFVDVSAAAGVQVRHPATGAPVGKALAVRPLDVNGDGRMDLAVANDTVGNFLFVNEGGGRFRETGADAGFAFDTSGAATGAMGIDAARYANDGRLAIAIGNFANEMSSFYVQRSGERLFSDDAVVVGVGAPSRRALTFGLLFADLDLDGAADLIAANGHVEPEINQVQASQRYTQAAQLFWNCGSACGWRYAPAERVGDLAKPLVGRGAAYADIDGDGDLDLALTQAGGRPALLRNDQETGHHWARFSLVGTPPNRHGIGALVSVRAADATQTRTVMPARSYLAQVELPVTFGLGAASHVDEVVVRWPDGSEDRWTDLPANQHHALRVGAGRRRGPP